MKRLLALMAMAVSVSALAANAQPNSAGENALSKEPIQKSGVDVDKNRDVLMAFYTKALTVNPETKPEDLLKSILADSFISYGSVTSKVKEQLIKQVSAFWKLIPDLKWEPQEIIKEGNRYIVRSIASGTPNGDFMGVTADGSKSFKIMTIDIHTIIDGKIVEIYHLEDWATALKQLKK
jgi:Predicted ester cyclase